MLRYGGVLTTHYSLHPTHYSPLTTHYYPLTTHHSLLATHYSLLTTHYSLLTTYCHLLQGSDSLLMEQRGIVRTNCLDCLNRTNMAQTALALHSATGQLQHLCKVTVIAM